jgi:hypothetical protein
MMNFLGKKAPAKPLPPASQPPPSAPAERERRSRASKLVVSGEKAMSLLQNAARCRERYDHNKADRLLEQAFEIEPPGQ